MARNYGNEAEWARKKYERFCISIEKELGKAFKEKAKKENKPVNALFREFMEKYVNE